MGAKPTPTHCQNDGAKLVGEYCHTCGQAANEPRRAFIGLVQDFFVDTLAIDGKLFRTIMLLLWRPGRLARRFLDGRRQHYSPPFRLYLFASVFFFIAVFWLIAGDVKAPTTDKKASPDEIAALEEGDVSITIAADPNASDDLAEPEEEEGEENQGDDFLDGLADGIRSDGNEDAPEWAKGLEARFRDSLERALEDPRLFIAQSREILPRVLLLAPVVYALLLSVLYIYRRKFYVYDHFVVSLYMHAALYAYLLAAILISQIPVIGFLWFAPLVWGLVQPIAVFRQAYRSNWLSVVGKSFIATNVYFTILIMLVVFGLSYSLYQS